MIILLTLIVIGLTKVLWWLKDFFRRERFEDIPQEDANLRLAYSQLTPDLQEQALETPIVETPRIEREYSADVQQGAQALAQTEAAFQQGVQALLASDPSVPIDQRLDAAQAPSGGAGGVGGADLQAQFQELLNSMQANALDQCFQKNCTTIQSAQDESCQGFAAQCYYQLDKDVSKCLKSLGERCSSEKLDACRKNCQMTAGTVRHLLNEGELLNANQYLRSLSGSTYLLLRDNGDLELYSYGRMLWTSARRQMSVNGTIHQGPFKLMIDPTGNIAVKNGLEMDAWSSNTWLDPMKSGSINGPYQLVVREKQAALINRSGAVLWDTQTAV